MEEIVLVLTTLPAGFDTETLARELVEARHAACVSVLPLQTSTYRWQGAIEMTSEHQVLIKTVAGKVDDLREALRNRHPYAVPEFLVLPVAGGEPAYLQWLRASLFES
jgi:periplasmic divalent cation tolerance protein